MPPGPRKLEIAFTAPSFVSPERIRFRYRLEGFGEDWNDAGARRTAYYTNLPPGDFTFVVQARRGDGLWEEAGAALRLRLEPFYYETYWFKGLMALLGAALVGGGVQWRVRSLKARKRQLEALVAERTSQLEAANRELERLANEDALTGIPNIRHFRACFEEEWRRAVRNSKPLSVILVDVDHFKAFNDLYGHPAGDECLRLVASILKGRVRRPGDLAARYGGEEFIVLLVNSDSRGAAAVARDLRLGVQAVGIKHEGSDAAKVVTVSLGCATALPGGDQRPGDLIDAADHALYRSKGEGRNRVTAVDLADVSGDSKKWT